MTFQIDYTAVLIFALVQVAFLIANIVTIRSEQKLGKEATRDRNAVVDKALASIDADIIVLYKHMNDSRIHQESMSVRELQTNFQAITDGQMRLALEIKTHVDNDREDMKNIHERLSGIKKDQQDGFKELRELFDDLRDRLPVRVPLPRTDRPD